MWREREDLSQNARRSLKSLSVQLEYWQPLAQTFFELRRVLRGKFCRVKAKCGFGGLQADSPGLAALVDNLPAKKFSEVESFFDTTYTKYSPSKEHWNYDCKIHPNISKDSLCSAFP